MSIERIREALADPALFDEGASVDDTLRACERWHAANSPEAIRELLAAHDALKADAERYRWLRDTGAVFTVRVVGDAGDECSVVAIDRPALGLDAAIDAAKERA